MRNPAEHKIIQARILEYVESIGWSFVPRKKAEQRRGFDPRRLHSVIGPNCATKLGFMWRNVLIAPH